MAGHRLDLPSGDEVSARDPYVYQRYGRPGAAMTANVITYRSKLGRHARWARYGFRARLVGTTVSVAGSWECEGRTTP